MNKWDSDDTHQKGRPMPVERISRRELVQKAIDARGTQLALALELQTSPQMISRWLNTFVRPSWAYMPRLARIAGVSLDNVTED